MKASIIFYVVGLLLVFLFGTGASKCGRNMVTTECNPCNQVCNEEARACALFCVENATFCACKSGFVLPNNDSTYCIPLSECPPKCD